MRFASEFAAAALPDQMDAFGEQCELRQVGAEGGDKLTVAVIPSGELDEDDHGNEDEIDQLVVLVKRGGRDGIDDPQVGLQLIRTEYGDPRPYLFSGIVERGSTKHYLMLRFARQKVTGRGGR